MKSHTTAIALCQPFFTPVGLGTYKRTRRLALELRHVRQVMASEARRSPSPRCVHRDKVVLCFLTRTCPSYTVPIPLWGSIPSGPFVCSGGTGHTAGALSAHVTWQEKLHTAETMNRSVNPMKTEKKKKTSDGSVEQTLPLEFFFFYSLSPSQVQP